MKYYKITCHTPFVGEEADYYLKSYNDSDLRRQIDECVYDNGSDWYDAETLEENDMTEDDYYSECGVRCIEEVTEEEYYKAYPWAKPKEEK